MSTSSKSNTQTPRVESAPTAASTDGFHARIASHRATATALETDTGFQVRETRIASPTEQDETRLASHATSLPLASSERLADGLPASGLRCTYDGGTFHCGDCRTDGDCPTGQGCVANRETRRFECMASECEEDMHCFPGTVCRPVNSGATGATLIRRCVPEGLRREGEHCDPLPVSPTGACREGLVCLHGLCSATCRPEDPSSCPEGHSCREGRNGPGCYPDCQKLGCPQGQQCKRLDDSSSQCLASVRGACPETACGEGERCNMRLFRGHGVFWCARVCNPLVAESCPAGQVCGMGSATVSTCYRQCDPMDLDSCGEGQACVTVSEDMRQWGCRPAPAR